MSIRELKNLLGMRGQFFLLVSLVIVGSAFSVGWYLTSRVESVHQDEVFKRGVHLVENLSFNAELPAMVGLTDELTKLAEGVMRDSLVTAVAFYDVSCDPIITIGDTSNIQLHCSGDNNSEHKSSHRPTPKIIGDPATDNIVQLVCPIVTWEGVLDRELLGSLSPENAGLNPGHWEQVGHVAVSVDLEPMRGMIRRARMTALYITIFVIAIALAITAWFLSIIVKPIERLAAASNDISRGNLERRIEYEGTGEIGALADSFNLMIDSLKRSEREVQEYQSTLEDKIKERTKELEDAQNQLLQSEKMSAVGQLAAGVAHELNNPLAGILGYSQFAMEKLSSRPEEGFDAKQLAAFKRYLIDIEKQARRCKTIVQNLLRFSRTSHDIAVSGLDVNKALRETIELLRHQVEIKQVSLTFVADESVPQIMGNSGKLQQVVTNLIINALHATDKGGAITVTSKHSPTLGEFDGAVEITIEDTGSGISEENISKIFEPFFTTKEVGSGTGLGLSVSYGIIKEHGGEIRVTSQVGVGSRFAVILPLQSKQVLSDT
ncbi:HAMP domain-containing histidine kinase [Gemmatimonas aurantiaca]|nr:HAMP domain-containing histidine kinase [Gemmatimonas aurantiaca]